MIQLFNSIYDKIVQSRFKSTELSTFTLIFEYLQSAQNFNSKQSEINLRIVFLQLICRLGLTKASTLKTI